MKKHLKSLICMALVFAMVLSLCACGKDSKSNSSATPTAATKDGETTTTGYADMNAIEFTAAMGNGVNLGNTFEAVGGERNFSAKAITDMTDTVAVTAAETTWGQPVTTQEMIEGIKAAGFDSIRIPIAWTKYMDNIATGDYTINAEFLDRVEEVVGWCQEAGLIVIINDHWDGGWWGMFGSEDQATVDTAFALYESMWAQVSERFADYDEFLVFEGGNEELGNRFNDAINGTAGNLTTTECYEMLTKVTQTFVDTVRAGEGYNANRFLLIPGYNTNIANTCDDQYVMPTDTVEGKLLISVHYYDPSTYCIGGSVAYWGTEDDITGMNTTLETMTKFTDAGYGVVIGEYGVANEAIAEDGAAPGGCMEYFTNFLANCDLYGYAPFLWDCSNYFVRNECAWTTAEGFADLNALYTAAQASTAEDLKAAAQTTIDTVLAGAHEDPNAIQDIREDDSQSIAWLMYSSSDWSISYSVGDKYDPGSATSGIVPTDVIIDGEGTYTVSLDISECGGASGAVFMALGIANGEANFPNYGIEITEFKINDTVYPCENYYTTSDDGTCTRVNLFNYWCGIEDDGVASAFVSNKNNEQSRIPASCDPAKITAWPIDTVTPFGETPAAAFEFGETANTISVTFNYFATE